MKRILFRADASQDIGYGHVIRSLALAEMLKDDFECIFVTRFLNPFLEKEINKICHKNIKLKEDDAHFDQFLTLLKGTEIVVLDNYFFSTDYQQKIKKSGCKLVCIDDLADRHFVADAVINQIDISPYKAYSKESYTKLFLGLENVLLRQEFFKDKLTKKKKGILIAFGGSDFYNLTYNYVKVLLKTQYELTVILNDKNIRYKDLIEWSKKYSNLKVYNNLTAKEVIKNMCMSEVVIIPSSTMCLEALALGCNIISGYYIDNQKYAYRYLKEKGYITGYGNLRDLDENKIFYLLNTSFKKGIVESPSKVMKESKKNHLRNFKNLN